MEKFSGRGLDGRFIRVLSVRLDSAGDRAIDCLSLFGDTLAIADDALVVEVDGNVVDAEAGEGALVGILDEVRRAISDASAIRMEPVALALEPIEFLNTMNLAAALDGSRGCKCARGQFLSGDVRDWQRRDLPAAQQPQQQSTEVDVADLIGADDD